VLAANDWVALSAIGWTARKIDALDGVGGFGLDTGSPRSLCDSVRSNYEMVIGRTRPMEGHNCRQYPPESPASIIFFRSPFVFP